MVKNLTKHGESLALVAALREGHRHFGKMLKPLAD